VQSSAATCAPELSPRAEAKIIRELLTERKLDFSLLEQLQETDREGLLKVAAHQAFKNFERDDQASLLLLYLAANSIGRSALFELMAKPWILSAVDMKIKSTTIAHLHEMALGYTQRRSLRSSVPIFQASW
jgi:hypothetical protein